MGRWRSWLLVLASLVLWVGFGLAQIDYIPGAITGTVATTGGLAISNARIEARDSAGYPAQTIADPSGA